MIDTVLNDNVIKPISRNDDWKSLPTPGRVTLTDEKVMLKLKI